MRSLGSLYKTNTNASNHNLISTFAFPLGAWFPSAKWKWVFNAHGWQERRCTLKTVLTNSNTNEYNNTKLHFAGYLNRGSKHFETSSRNKNVHLKKIWRLGERGWSKGGGGEYIDLVNYKLEFHQIQLIARNSNRNQISMMRNDLIIFSHYNVYNSKHVLHTNGCHHANGRIHRKCIIFIFYFFIISLEQIGV